MQALPMFKMADHLRRSAVVVHHEELEAAARVALGASNRLRLLVNTTRRPARDTGRD